MSTKISKFAVIDETATIGPDVEIGPFCVVGPDVEIGRGCRLDNNVTVAAHSTIGEFNRFHPGVVIGGEPQDLSFDGTVTRVVIGDHNVFRECVTVNRATTKEDHLTTVGSRCYFMGCVHIAHDCKIGDNVVIANGSMLGGHVHVDDHATISGAVAVHHFTSIGRYSFIGGLSRTLQDVPPFMLVEGNPCRPRCVNIVALKRNDFEQQSIRALNESYRLLFRSRVGVENAREILRARGQLVAEVNHLLDFILHQQEGRHGRGRERRRAA